MIPKKKLCSGCKQVTFIWKSSGGMKLCKQCSYTGVAKLSNIKPTAKAKPIAPHSQKRSKEERIYLGKRLIFLKEHPMCQAHLPGLCSEYSTDIHHKQGRVGDNLLDETEWLAVCRGCHEWIEAHPQEAKDRGFSTNRL